MPQQTEPVAGLVALDLSLISFAISGLIYIGLSVFGVLPHVEMSARPVPYWVWGPLFGSALAAAPFVVGPLLSYLGQARDPREAASRAMVVVTMGQVLPQVAAILALVGYIVAQVPDRHVLVMQALAAFVVIVICMWTRTAVRNQLSRHGIR